MMTLWLDLFRWLDLFPGLDGVSFVPPINSTISQKSDRLILWAVVQDMDVDNDLGDVAESEEADSPKRSAKKIPLVV